MQKVTIEIEGMHCGMCESHVNDLFRKAVPLKKVQSSHLKNQTTLIGEGPYEEETIRKALDGSGYQVGKITIEAYQKKGLFSFFKK